MFLKKRIVCFVILGGLLVGEKSASAQGLIWKLPADRTWVEFEGEYSQTEFRPNSLDGDLKPGPWNRRLKISSVGRQMAEYNGQMVACRWIELEVRTVHSDELFDSDPATKAAGARIYKVLVPESKIIGNTTDSDGIPVSMIPIVKGYRKIGDGNTEPIPLDNDKGGVLQVYPVISLLRHYKTLEPLSDQPDDAGINVPARRYRAVKIMESPTSRSTHTAKLWRSSDMPFGLAGWSVKILREEKGRTEPRTAFKRVSEISIEMKAVKDGGNATSKIAEQ